MPSTRRREEKSAAPSPSPARVLRAQSAASETSVTSGAHVPDSVEETEEEHAEDDGASDEQDEDSAEPEEQEEQDEEQEEKQEEKRKPTLEERKAKLRELRLRMNASTAANRKDLVEDHQKSKVTAKELQRLEKQRKLAQTLRLKADAAETGEDLERKKAWEWSIEQNEQWEKKQAQKDGNEDGSFSNYQDHAWRRYNKNLRTTKPDLIAYNKQKESALGLAPGTLVPAGSTNDSLAAAGPSNKSGLSGAEDLYRTSETMSYGDHKPSDDAIDRVMSKINKDVTNRRRKKDSDDESGDVTYINKRNKVFNKKVARYFDKYTKDIRANMERGTAL